MMPVCTECGAEEHGGMSVMNGKDLVFYCWKDECQEAGWKIQRKEARNERRRHKRAGLCGFNLSWAGLCEEKAGTSGFCEEHEKKKCWSCKEQATHECSETGMFVCGVPLCSKHGCYRH